jgi:hypothetical protein
LTTSATDLAGAVPGPMSGRNVIGETTEAVHKFLLDGYNLTQQPPRIEEDLKFIPKDREEVLYIYMYRLAQNQALQNRKRLRQAPVFTKDDPEEGGAVYFHRPPMPLDLYYLVAVHAKFRSDAERLMGWVLLRLNEATHLIYRPRQFILPDGSRVDSLGRPYDPTNFDGIRESEEDEDDGLFLEKVSLALVDDLTVGDAINLFTLHEAPYRPFLTYRARVALDGPLYKSVGGAQIKMGRIENQAQPLAKGAVTSANGRVRPGTPPPRIPQPPGPRPYMIRKMADSDSESED